MHSTGAYLLLNDLESISQILTTGVIDSISGSFPGRIAQEAIGSVRAKMAEKNQKATYVLLAWGVRVNFTPHTRSLIEISRIALFECQTWTLVQIEQGP